MLSATADRACIHMDVNYMLAVRGFRTREYWGLCSLFFNVFSAKMRLLLGLEGLSYSSGSGLARDAQRQAYFLQQCYI